MQFLTSLLSRKLGVTAAAIALIQTLPLTADTKGICTAALALAYILGQAYVDAHAPKPPEDAPAPAPKAEP